jgi:hypothetical protein
LIRGVSSSSLQNSVFKTSTQAFEDHDFFSSPGTVLRFALFLANSLTFVDSDVMQIDRVLCVYDESEGIFPKGLLVLIFVRFVDFEISKGVIKLEIGEDAVAEMRAIHGADESFSVELFNLRKVWNLLFEFFFFLFGSFFGSFSLQKRLLQQKDLTEVEVLSVLKHFSELREADFVVSYSGEEAAARKIV